MPTLNIPLASSVFFVYTTTGSAIRTGEIIADNEFYPNGTYTCGVNYPAYSQPYNCDDEVEFQIEYENGSIRPWLQIMDTDDVVQYTLVGINVNTDFWEWSFIWSDIIVECPACLYLRYVTPSPGSNLVTCADNGTFETGAVGAWGFSTGGTNTITKVSTPVAHGGTYSASIGTPGSVTASERELGFCTASFALSANTYYEYSAWVYDNDISPAIQDGRQITFDISDFSDATTINTDTITPSVDGRGAWHNIKITFLTGSDVSGQIKIVTNADPQTNGFMYIDDMTLNAQTLTIEAQSNNIQLESDHECTELVKYYSDNDTLNQYFTGGLINRIRLPIVVHRPNVFSENEIFLDSKGTRSKVSSYLGKTYPIEFGYLPDYMIWIIQIAIEHDNFLISDIGYITDNQYEPEEVENYSLRKGTLEMFLSDYDLQNTKC